MKKPEPRATHICAATTEKHRPSAASRTASFGLLVACESGARIVPLTGAEVFIIGRTAECDVSIEDASISRAHARLVLGETLTLEDLGSTNGTKVQGKRLQRGERIPIAVGTVFELGSATCVLQRMRGLQPTQPGLRTKSSTRAKEPPSDEGAPILCEPTMRNLYALLEVIAPSPLNVLILGETGVGKELYAAAVHAASDRAQSPFLRLNCAALPESIAEAELFGYEKGAFTGAVQTKQGLFESANGGTVFLDEVAELPLAIQAKLLRVVESGEVLRLGSVKPKHVAVRFVAATNRDPRRLIVEGTFREDLYFRLNGISITIPPLRRRPADIAPIARRFADRLCKALGRPQIDMTESALRALEHYAWPGNVRELKNVVERAVVLCRKDELDLEQLVVACPEAFATPADSASADASTPKVLREELKALEKERIIEVLAETAGNQSQAAKKLGMSRFTLMTRIEQYGLSRPRKRS